MSTDDYGTEYVYPPAKWGESPILHATDGSLRISAQDERFASVNEAIGLLQYNAEQDSERIDDLLVRVEKLEAAQPIPQISRATMDSDGVLLSHDAYDALERDAAIGRSVPWVALDRTVRYGMGAYMPNTTVNTLRVMGEWCDAYMPKELEEAA